MVGRYIAGEEMDSDLKLKIYAVKSPINKDNAEKVTQYLKNALHTRNFVAALRYAETIKNARVNIWGPKRFKSGYFAVFL